MEPPLPVCQFEGKVGDLVREVLHHGFLLLLPLALVQEVSDALVLGQGHLEGYTVGVVGYSVLDQVLWREKSRITL